MNERVNVERLRALTDAGWSDDLLMPKSIVRLLCDELEARRTVSERETKYARDLAVSLHRQHYSEEAPQWKPFDDLYGILTQIDNMAVGLRRTVSGQEESASDAVEAEALRALDKATQDGHSYDIESYCAGYVDRHYAAPIPATEPKEPK